MLLFTQVFLPSTPSAASATTVDDLILYLYYLGTLGLLGLSTVLLRRLVKTMDDMKDTQIETQIEQRGLMTSLTQHVNDQNAHCKGMNCRSFDRRKN